MTSFFEQEGKDDDTLPASWEDFQDCFEGKFCFVGKKHVDEDGFGHRKNICGFYSICKVKDFLVLLDENYAEIRRCPSSKNLRSDFFMQADMELLSPCCHLWPLEAEKICFLWQTAYGGSEATVSLSYLSLQLMYNVYFFYSVGSTLCGNARI